MFELPKKALLQALDRGCAATLILDARDSRHSIVYANETMEQLTGWDVSELLGRELADMLADGEMPSADDGLGGAERRLAQRWLCRDGSQQPLEFRLAPLFSRPGAPTFWLLSQLSGERPASPPKRPGRSDNLDQVTGLPNRRSFDELLRRDWGIARREQRRLTMILFRMDALDEYRNLFGRHATDACMQKVSHAISGSLHRAGDAVARIDAAHFAVLIGSASESQASEFALRIASKVRELAIHHPRSAFDRYVTLSYGIASMTPARDAAANQLLVAAESSLLQQIDDKQALVESQRSGDAGQAG